MSAVAEKTGGRTAAAQPPKPHRDDQEFLPADLAILETPPSPVRMAFILLICAFVVVALAWCWFGRIDIIAVAQGKVQPAGRVKVIEPLETGKVAAIRVENGSHVKAGDVLIEMERGDAQAEEAGAAAALASYRAEAARRRAALDAANQQQLSPVATIAWTEDIPAANRTREEQVLSGDLAQLASALASLDAQAQQKEVARDRMNATILAQEDLIATLKERVDMRSTLANSGSGSKAALIDAMETMKYQQTVLQTQKGQRDDAMATLNVLTRERQKIIDAFTADNSQKLAEAQRQADDFEQKLAKARLKSGRMTLSSPIDGVVLGLSVTTVGQVIATGDEIMRIVPEDATLEIECYLANKDVGFVKPGQTAVVKIESFPFTRYGTLSAQVRRVAHDAIPEPDAQQAEGDPSRTNKQDKLFAGAQRTQNLVFSVTLTPNKTVMNVDGQIVPLTPGMAVSVEIATGNRRILEYLFSPLVEVGSEALRER
jgi:hemolysin D